MGVDREGAEIKVNGAGRWVKRFHTGNPTQGTGFNSPARTLGDGANLVLGWLLEAWKQQGLTLRELEMPALLCRWQRKISKGSEKGASCHGYTLCKARKSVG